MYENKNKNSGYNIFVSTPAADNFPASIKLRSSGRSTGNASTGYKVPFEFALEIIAAIMVEAETSPKFPKKNVTVNPVRFLIIIPVAPIKRTNIIMFITNDKVKLNISFPARTSGCEADNFKANDVSFSSSLINTLERPLDAEKKTTIQNKPDRISLSVFSSPNENLIIAIVTITNIRRELKAYLVLNSDLKSFLNISSELLSN